jgi:hypothetical protein
MESGKSCLSQLGEPGRVSVAGENIDSADVADRRNPRQALAFQAKMYADTNSVNGSESSAKSRGVKAAKSCATRKTRVGLKWRDR